MIKFGWSEAWERIQELKSENKKLKAEIEDIKFGDQKFCYLDELIKINKESLKEKTKLKQKVVELEYKLQKINEIVGN